MKIKIEMEVGDAKRRLTVESAAEIQAALDKVNGRATAFTVDAAATVGVLAREGEDNLVYQNIPESERAGATLTYRPGGPSANAYKNSAISTKVTLKRTGSGWYLVAVERAEVWPRNGEKYTHAISDRAARNGVKRFLSAFGRTEMPAEEDAQLAA